MDSKRDDDNLLEGQYAAAEDALESYPRLLSNQASDVLDMLGEAGSETKYMDGQDYSQYGLEYGQDDSGTAA